MSVVVLGSINLDLVIEVPRLPVKGETIVGDRFFAAAGGRECAQRSGLEAR